MVQAEAKCLLINHPYFFIAFERYETYAKSVGAGVYEVAARKAP